MDCWCRKRETRDINRIISSNLLTILGKRKVKQKQLADYLDISQAALSDKIAGKENYVIVDIRLMSKFFDVPVSY